MTRRQAHTAASLQLGEANIASPRITEGRETVDVTHIYI